MDPSSDHEIIENICDYAERVNVKDILKEYIKRLILDKPSDPIKYLIKSIEENPYNP
jgi:hypothetical protein